VPERDRVAVDVDDLLTAAEHPRRVDRDRRECLVDLQQNDVGDVEPRLVERVPQRDRRNGVKVRKGFGAHAARDDLGERLESQSRRPLALMTVTVAAPSESCDALAAVILPAGVNAGGSVANESAVVSGRMPSSSVHTLRPAPAGSDLNGDNLVVEAPALARTRGAPVRMRELALRA
jgi:hypothetical protein